MVARTQLAALDHNTTNGRQQATITRGANEGEHQCKLVYPKHTKEWVTKPIMETASRDYLSPILDAIVDRKRRKPRERSAALAAPRVPNNKSSKPKPPRADIITKLTTRFSNS